VVIGFHVVRMAAPEPVQWVVLLIAAILGTFALYGIIRRVGVLRFLFGMRPRVRKTEVPASVTSTSEMRRGDV
ncbi:MAG: hypothetical protein ABH877_03910, partial [bacterium]